MDEKNAPQGTALPDAMQNKELQENYIRNLEEMEDDIFREYTFMVLSLFCVFNVGFWVSYFWRVMFL